MKNWTANIEHWKVDKLIPYARNARTHSDAQVAQIAASIVEFGFTNPILAGSDGVIVAGHGRLLAAHVPYWPLESHFLHMHRQRSYERWMLKDLAMLARCDILLRLPGESNGSDREVAEAQKIGIPVCFGWDELIEIIQTGP